MKDKVELKPCPCGKTPKELYITGVDFKWKYACGDCCGEWIIEFMANYAKEGSKELMDLAIEAWNKTIRADGIQTSDKDK